MNDRAETEREEQNLARMLRAAGRRREMPAEMQQRWEASFRTELKARIDERRVGRRRLWTALCAGLAVVATAYITLIRVPPQDSVHIEVAAVHGDVLYQQQTGESAELQPGQMIPPGGDISTEAEGFVALRYRGYDLRINHNTRIVTDHDRIFMSHGELYVSDSSKPIADGILIVTPGGAVRDIGTQFRVKFQGEHLETTVRRGAVVVSLDEVSLRADADVEGPMRITVEPGSVPTKTPASGSTADWKWIYQGAKPYVLDGSSADEFLRWSVAESGMQLRYAGDAARIYATTIVLHGNLGGLDPERAVAPVLATTDLRVQTIDSEILLISLER